MNAGLISWGAAVALTAALWLLTASPASADTFKPTRLDDPPPGPCKPTDCSLREAINAANIRDGGDRVELEGGTYELEIPVGMGGADDPLEGDLDPGFYIDTGKLKVLGRGPAKTRIDANGLDRVIDSAESVVVRALTVTGGDPGPSRGGGVLVDGHGHSRLERVAIKGNFAGGRGGGLSYGGNFSSGSALALDRVTITGNQAQDGGGGVSSFGPDLKITDSRIAGNAAAEGGGVELRGALGPQPNTTIRSSTISGNSAGKGGGILADRIAQPGELLPVAVVVNSTVAANEATAEGGGVMADNSASMLLDNSTVAYNVADADDSGGGTGGGIHQHAAAGFQFVDSIVAANTVGTSGEGPQCQGFFETGGDVVQIQFTGACSFSNTPTLVGDALIGPLADNGGPTKTIKLRSGSPAVERAEVCPGKDQRGKPRPDVECDSGSFERAGP